MTRHAQTKPPEYAKSIVNEVIRVILSLFLRKGFTSKKNNKMHKKNKKHKKRKKSNERFSSS